MEKQLEVSPLGLIAGKGDLPRLLVEECKAQGRPIYILALEGQTEDSLIQNENHWFEVPVQKCETQLQVFHSRSNPF